MHEITQDNTIKAKIKLKMTHILQIFFSKPQYFSNLDSI